MQAVILFHQGCVSAPSGPERTGQTYSDSTNVTNPFSLLMMLSVELYLAMSMNLHYDA